MSQSSSTASPSTPRRRISARVRIGLIADTHDFLDSDVSRLLAGVDHILHAGDVGRPHVLLGLEAIAPVTAVLGNTDDPGHGYREFEQVELGGLRFLIHHIVDPVRPSDRLHRRLETDQPDVIVFGHTHIASRIHRGGRLFLNPGYAGAPRSGRTRTLARVDLDPDSLEPRFQVIPLPDRGPSAH